MSNEESDAARFAEIVSKYEHELRRFLSHYLPNRADVEDCTQEALLHVWRQAQRGLLRDDARAYIFTTAFNVVRDFWRRDKVRHGRSHVDLSEDMEGSRSIGTEKQIAERQAIRIIDSQLDKLKPSTKAVFLLYHVENLTPQEIATRLGVSVRTVEREMARALDFCRSTLGGVVKDFLED